MVEASRQPYDKRAQTEASIAKRQRIDDEHGRSSVLPAPFSQDEIAAEERKPKHKVAVMIGYSGTGYRGMQMCVDAIEREIQCGFADAHLETTTKRRLKATYSLPSLQLVPSPKPTPTIPRNRRSSAVLGQIKAFMPPAM